MGREKLHVFGRKAIPWLLARFCDFERQEHAPRRPAGTYAFTVVYPGGSPACPAAESAIKDRWLEEKSCVFRQKYPFYTHDTCVEILNVEILNLVYDGYPPPRALGLRLESVRTGQAKTSAKRGETPRSITRARSASGATGTCPMRRAATRTECCLLYTSPSPRDLSTSRMPSSA